MTTTTSLDGAPLLRPVRALDEPWRRSLFAQSRSDLAALPMPVREQVLDLQWQAQARQYGADHPHARWRIVELDGTAVGQVVVDESGTAIHLVDITVAGEHRGRGLASAVLAELLTAADAAGRTVELCVWAENATARRLYERVGFEYLSTEGTGYLPMRRTPVERDEAAR